MAVLIAVLALLLAACGGRAPRQTGATTPHAAEPAAVNVAQAPAPAAPDAAVASTPPSAATAPPETTAVPPSVASATSPTPAPQLRASAPPRHAGAAVPAARPGVASRTPPQGGAAVNIWRGNPARRSVALTFDAGADRGYAEWILNVLWEHGVRATFGVTGVWAQQNPDLVQRMAWEGHRLMNHSYDHSSFTGLSTSRRALTAEQRWWQLDVTEGIIVELTGQSTLPLFRTPYGDTDATVLRDIAARGYAYNILWTVDSGGWRGISAAAIIRRCLAQAQPGAIYVFHVGAAAHDGPALPAIIAGLRDAGYAFETVDEILQ